MSSPAERQLRKRHAILDGVSQLKRLLSISEEARHPPFFEERGGPNIICHVFIRDRDDADHLADLIHQAKLHAKSPERIATETIYMKRLDDAVYVELSQDRKLEVVFPIDPDNALEFKKAVAKIVSAQMAPGNNGGRCL